MAWHRSIPLEVALSLRPQYALVGFVSEIGIKADDRLGPFRQYQEFVAKRAPWADGFMVLNSVCGWDGYKEMMKIQRIRCDGDRRSASWVGMDSGPQTVFGTGKSMVRIAGDAILVRLFLP